jgi:putative ABC transport system permease protein
MQFIEDLRYALRQIRRGPGFALFIIATLAIGIGANTTIFGAVNAVLLRPLPWADGERLVQLSGAYPNRGDDWSVSLPNAIDWGKRSRVLDGSAYYQGGNFTLTGDQRPERIDASRVSASLLPLVGAQPLMGRHFLESEAQPDAERVVMLSHSVWQSRYGADPAIIGRAITLSGSPYTVIAVLRPGFSFPQPGIELYVPVRANETTWNRSSGGLSVIAKMRQGVTIEQTQRDLDLVSADLAREYPGPNAELTAEVKSLRSELYGENLPLVLFTLFGAVAFVLMIACVNVANLLLARATGREREVAVRTAIGASRNRVIRQLLTESLVLAVLGGAAGLLLSILGSRLLLLVFPTDSSVPREIGLDPRVLGFTAGIALLTGVIFGLAPALHASRTDLTSLIGGRSGTQTRRRTRARATLVVAQVALAAMLLVTAGLMIRSLQTLMGRDPGFTVDNLLTMRVQLDAAYNEQAKSLRFQQQALENLRALPGVLNAGAVDWLPLDGTNNFNDVSFGDRPIEQRENVGTVIVTPGYLEAMNIQVQRGRTLDERDVRSAPGVVLVNRALASKYWGDRDPIGQRILFTWEAGQNPYWRTVVGVVDDVLHGGLDEEHRTEVYVPFAQLPWNSTGMSFAIRTRGDPLAIRDAAKSAIWSIDRNQAVYDDRSMERVVRESGSVVIARILAGALGLFGLIALLLAALGLYGVISYGVAQRTYEIGVRGALGATRADVLKLIMGQGLTLVVVGLVIGLAGAFAAVRITRSMLYGISAYDPTSFVQAIVALIGVAVLATMLPARRAARIDPSIALRAE